MRITSFLLFFGGGRLQLERHINIIAHCVKVREFSEAYAQWMLLSKEHPQFMGDCLVVMNFLAKEAKEVSKVIGELKAVLDKKY